MRADPRHPQPTRFRGPPLVRLEHELDRASWPGHPAMHCAKLTPSVALLEHREGFVEVLEDVTLVHG